MRAKEDVVLVSETHLSKDKTQEAIKRAGQAGFVAVAEPAFESGRSDSGTSAGILILVKACWFPVPIDEDLVLAICPSQRGGVLSW